MYGGLHETLRRANAQLAWACEHVALPLHSVDMLMCCRGPMSATSLYKLTGAVELASLLGGAAKLSAARNLASGLGGHKKGLSLKFTRR